jgi:hypothetical protein
VYHGCRMLAKNPAFTAEYGSAAPPCTQTWLATVCLRRCRIVLFAGLQQPRGNCHAIPLAFLRGLLLSLLSPAPRSLFAIRLPGNEKAAGFEIRCQIIWAKITFASRADLVAKDCGRTLTATSRCNRVSRALHTSPMPPAPMGAKISYGPSWSPTESGIYVSQLSLTFSVADRSWVTAYGSYFPKFGVWRRAGRSVKNRGTGRDGPRDDLRSREWWSTKLAPAVVEQ